MHLVVVSTEVGVVLHRTNINVEHSDRLLGVFDILEQDL